MVRLDVEDFIWLCKYVGLTGYHMDLSKAQKVSVIDGYIILTKYLLNNYRLIRYRVNIDEILKGKIENSDMYRLLRSGKGEAEIASACIKEALKIIMIQDGEDKDALCHKKIRANMMLQLICEKIQLLDLLPFKGRESREVIEAQYINGDFKMIQSNVMQQFDYALTVYYQLRNSGIENLSATLWNQKPI